MRHLADVGPLDIGALPELRVAVDKVAKRAFSLVQLALKGLALPHPDVDVGRARGEGVELPVNQEDARADVAAVLEKVLWVGLSTYQLSDRTERGTVGVGTYLVVNEGVDGHRCSPGQMGLRVLMLIQGRPWSVYTGIPGWTRGGE